MSGTRRQLGLPLAASPTYLADDFVVTGCNRLAYETVLGAPLPVLVLYGPEASGKTHLAHIWTAREGAAFIDPAALTQGKIAAMLAEKELATAYVVDGLESLADEAALFHLLNGIREQGGRLLLVSCAAPSHLGLTLADARSRLNAAPAVALNAPDDVLLRTVLVKQFADRQLRVGEEVVHYLLARMERSFASARAWVVRIDEASLADQRKVTVAWLRQLMEQQDGV